MGKSFREIVKHAGRMVVPIGCKGAGVNAVVHIVTTLDDKGDIDKTFFRCEGIEATNKKTLKELVARNAHKIDAVPWFKFLMVEEPTPYHPDWRISSVVLDAQSQDTFRIPSLTNKMAGTRMRTETQDGSYGAESTRPIYDSRGDRHIMVPDLPRNRRRLDTIIKNLKKAQDRAKEAMKLVEHDAGSVNAPSVK